MPKDENEEYMQLQQEMEACLNVVWDKLLELGLDTDSNDANVVKEAMAAIAEQLGLPDDY